ncbi:YktB family protein [Neobacillus sp. NPDC097160]|uniref:YktB family protein n=1 Tax=Neobacillus sp. NPDC097160 TaxID=3364298 RepID=UPI00381FCE2E
MDFNGFTNEDFDVFEIDGLEARMDSLKSAIRPKLEGLGDYFAPTLSTLTGDEMFVHVAKHARRTINPPKDTWVAFANNPRGYKMLPHFQIGLWNTHLFIWFAVIYEAPQKEIMGARFTKKAAKIFKEIPKDFVWSLDHMKPDTIPHKNLSKDNLLSYFERMQNVKKAELLCGYTIDREKTIELGSEGLIRQIEDVFNKVSPLYKIAQNSK